MNHNSFIAAVHWYMKQQEKEAKMNAENAPGKKFDQGKPRMDLISHYSMIELAKVLSFGAEKYDSWNWSKGIVYSRVTAAVYRHMGAWNNREDKDPESNLSHLAHALCGLMFLVDYEVRNLNHLDDRRPVDSIISKENVDVCDKK